MQAGQRADGAAEAPARQARSQRRESGARATAGAQQMKMLRRLPKILRFIPGTAQDVRAYFLTLQYWLAGSEQNIANMVRFLVDRYARRPAQASCAAR
jgi:magnesium chelatase subunit H